MSYRTLTFRLDDQSQADIATIRLALMGQADDQRGSSAACAVRVALRMAALEIQRAQSDGQSGALSGQSGHDPGVAGSAAPARDTADHAAGPAGEDVPQPAVEPPAAVIGPDAAVTTGRATQ